MDVWTIQKKEIIEDVKAGNTYFPDCDYCGTPGLELCYLAATGIVNRLNHTNYKGVVFTMAAMDGSPFTSAYDIRRMLEGNGNLEGFLRKDGLDLRSDGNVLVRLRYPDSVNPASLDVCAFTAFSDYLSFEVDPSMKVSIVFDRMAAGVLPPQKMEAVYEAWMNGNPPVLLYRTLSTFLQLHYGSIAPENLTGEEYPATILRKEGS